MLHDWMVMNNEYKIYLAIDDSYLI